MLHDYHLYRAAEPIRRARSKAILSHFNAHPWPPSSIWLTITPRIREAIAPAAGQRRGRLPDRPIRPQLQRMVSPSADAKVDTTDRRSAGGGARSGAGDPISIDVAATGAWPPREPPATGRPLMGVRGSASSCGWTARALEEYLRGFLPTSPPPAPGATFRGHGSSSPSRAVTHRAREYAATDARSKRGRSHQRAVRAAPGGGRPAHYENDTPGAGRLFDGRRGARSTRW